MNKDMIYQAEQKIDSSFGNNDLKKVGYSQAVWTLLSVVEDHNLKNTQIRPLDNVQLAVHVDGLINSITYPIRVCFSESDKSSTNVCNRLKGEHYQLAQDWISNAIDYCNFCSVFTLWHNGKIEITIDDYRLNTSDWRELEIEYEAYNRIIKKEGKQKDTILDPNKIINLVVANTTVTEDEFRLNFNPKLVTQLVSFWSPLTELRYSLPEEWQFSYFTIGQFKAVFTTIQAMLCGWYLARVAVAQSGMPAAGYRSAVYVVEREELLARLTRYTSLKSEVIQKVLEALNFGSCGVRNPDIAIQPLIDLNNGCYALSPFIWLNTNAERNICVLLNQIKEERKIYSTLTNEKESVMRHEIEVFLQPYGYDFKYGKVQGTDLDFAIIDRKNKVCLCLEIKWFIEPAEIREIKERSEELKKGVQQAEKIKTLFRKNDESLIKDLLQIDSGYFFSTAVASKNWIGHFDVQDKNVPIIKFWHLLNTIKTLGSLKEAIVWLNNREYLPKKDIDYKVHPMELSCGKWQTTWYGIQPISP